MMTKYIFSAAALYSLFVIYGSLVPLDYKFMPLNEALDQFRNINYLNLGIGSLADWVANILLMIPLAFLWFTLLTKNSRFPTKLLFFLLIWSACFVLALTIEFTQLFFPQRTVSINDLIAEGLGSFIGCLVGWFFGQRFLKWLELWHQEAEINAWDRYLQIYMVGLFLYAVLPLDLTLSPVELFHKWKEGRIFLLPFTSLKATFIENIYQWGSDVALWLPVPLLWQRNHRLTRLQLYQRLFFAALTIEFFQLFVYSRVTDITDILLALLGGTISIYVTKYLNELSLSKPAETNFQSMLSLPSWWGAIVAVLWTILLLAVFWYPFNFDFDSALIAESISLFFKVPFYSYYYGTEFRAATEVIHKILFFIPLGMAFSFISYRYKFRVFSRYISYFGITLIALGIETGQIFLPKKNADLTDLILEITGGVIGYMLFKQYKKSTYDFHNSPLHVHAKDVASQPVHISTNLNHLIGKYKIIRAPEYKENNIKTPRFQLWITLLLAISILAVILFSLSNLTFMPYNVRELISGEDAWLRCFGLSSVLFWCLGFPVAFLTEVLSRKRKNFWYCWIGIGSHCIVAWALLRLSVPLESIYDIVGSPVITNMPTELELFLRLMAFFGIFSLLCFGSVMVVNSILGCYSNLLKYYVDGVVVFVILLPIYYWVVVLEAATDNIVELLPDEGRSWLIILIAIYVFLFSFIGSAFSAMLALKKWKKLIWILLMGFISYPLGYLLMQWGTEPFIMKYGVIFSALQFLFSSDRNNYVLEDVLKFRFYCAHSAFILITIITQFPQWRVICQQKN